MADRWSWVLADGHGDPLQGAMRARGRRLYFVRNHADHAQLTLSHSDPAAVKLFDALADGFPILTVFRNGVVVFAGHWDPMSGGHQADGDSFVNLVFKSAFAQLDYRLGAPSVSYVATDAGAIVQDLITNTDADYDPVSLTFNDTFELTRARDRTYDHKVLSEAIIELTEVEGGFDWYPTYRDPDVWGGATMLFNIVPALGSDQAGAIFEFGTGTLENCRAYSYTFTRPITIVRALGAGGLYSEQEDESARDRYGSIMVTVSATDVTEQATLDDKARDALRPDPVMVTEFSGDPAVCPLPWDHFWIGDTIRFNVDDDAVQQQLQPRVQTIEVGLDEDDNIADLVVGIDPGAAGAFEAPTHAQPAQTMTRTRRYVQQQRELLRRLSALER